MIVLGQLVRVLRLCVFYCADNVIKRSCGPFSISPAQTFGP
jgi:hypothetical protein